MRSRDDDPIIRHMENIARRAKAERADFDRFLREPAHLLEIGLGCGRPINRTIAHDVETQRRMRQLNREIDIVGPAFQSLYILGESLPVPRQTFG